ncbi:MAG: molybdopterin cofactor-binding domain-containing protein, partial [Gemmatimonadota bacterium]
MTKRSEVSRRDFVRAGVAAGAGITIAVYLTGCDKPDPNAPKAGKGPEGPFKANAWVEIAPSGLVTLAMDRSEMGQGVFTSLPMLLAEELDVDPASITLRQATPGKAYANAALGGIQATGGSSSIKAAWKPLREAGAQARAMLVSAAAAKWGVKESACSTAAGSVVHADSNRKLSYGELVSEASKLKAPEKVSLKDPKDWKYIGKPFPRIDLADKVVGTAGYGIDAKVPGLLVARVARCPVFGGKAVSHDAEAAKKVPGVKHVLAISSGIAVVADGYWQAGQGLKALNVQWDPGPNGKLNTESIRAELKSHASGAAIQARKEGAGNASQKGKQVTAEYEVPYLAHACMEPMNATASVEAGKCTVWAPTQYQWGGGGGTLETAAKAAGVPESAVTVNTTLLGGGFGRRFMQDFVVEAVECSKGANAPVKVVWSREDDIQHDFYRPTAYTKATATLGADGMPVSWVARVVAPSINVSTAGASKDKLDGSTVEAWASHPY